MNEYSLSKMYETYKPEAPKHISCQNKHYIISKKGNNVNHLF
jgi:hypothetical protein